MPVYRVTVTDVFEIDAPDANAALDFPSVDRPWERGCISRDVKIDAIVTIEGNAKVIPSPSAPH